MHPSHRRMRVAAKVHRLPALLSPVIVPLGILDALVGLARGRRRSTSARLSEIGRAHV